MTESVLWRRLDLPGHEFGRLGRRGDRWELSGTAVFAHERRPCTLRYLVTCDAQWRTMSAWVEGVVGDRAIDLKVAIDAERRWYLNGTACQAIAGCLDIDLGFSPSTNLLPIRRLTLNVGEEAEVRAAWLAFPALEFEVLPQVYRRDGERTYRYTSGGGRFTRVLQVNAVGFVTSYPGLWQVESAHDATP